MPVIEQFRKDLRKKGSRWLNAYAANVTSQSGEDGVIAKIFGVIGEQSRWCVEFGAWDGKLYSNTYDLIAAKGWSGVLIEGSSQKFTELRQTYTGNPHAICLNAIVHPASGPGSLETLLATTEIPHAFDLLSIDIDGNDYHAWESLVSYRPRVVVIEFNPMIPSDILFIQDADIAINQGCSLRALIALGKRKGYELAAVIGTNAMFVTEQDFGKLGIADNDIDAMFLSACDGKYFVATTARCTMSVQIDCTGSAVRSASISCRSCGARSVVTEMRSQRAASPSGKGAPRGSSASAARR